MNPQNPLYPITQYAEQQEATISDLQKQVSDRLNQINDQQQQIDTLAAQIAQQNAQIASQATQIQAQTAAIAELQRQVICQRVIGSALTFDFENIPYHFGGEWDTNVTLDKESFDCSAFTQLIWNIGSSGAVKLPRVSKNQATVGKEITFDQMLPGDAIFYAFNTTGEVSHVATFIGNDQIIQTNTPATGINIQKSSWNKGSIVTIRRFI